MRKQKTPMNGKNDPMSELRLQLFGSPALLLDGENIAEQLPVKAQAVLIYLAVTGQPQKRLWIASLLWSEAMDSVALKNLRDILPQLRKTMGTYLHVTRQMIAFNRERPYFLDVEAFQLNLQREPQTSAGLQQTIDLYVDEFLLNFYVPQAALFEEWQMLWREKLHELALRHMDILVERYIEEREWERGSKLTQRLLQLEPWRESAHRQRMLLFAYTGRRNGALAQYETCRKTLAEEFGIEPTAQTRLLYEKIIAGEIAQPRETAVSRSAKTLHNLPRSLTPFFGRQEELAQVTAQLGEKHNRPLLTIMGEGGMGKTRLALAAARELLGAFADGIWFVPLANIPPPADLQTATNQLMETIEDTLNLTLSDANRSVRKLQRQLEDRRLLLILDNFEHLIAGTPFVLDLLAACPQLSVLITSRERLNAQAEFVVRLEGLPVPKSDSAVEFPDLTKVSSLQLFTERATRSTPGFALDDTNLTAVIRICQLVGGLPLGIELAAVLTEYQSCAKIADALTVNYKMLTASLHDLPQRHHSLQTVFDYSWERLSDEEALTFARCAVFRGGFTATAVAAVMEVPFAHLTALSRKSLLRPLGNGRFDIHELIRHFAAAKLADLQSGEDPIEARHCDYYVNFVHKRQDRLENETAVLRQLQIEINNIRAAWRWASQNRMIAALFKAAPGLSGFYRLVGLYREAHNAFCQTIAVLKEPPITEESQLLLGRLYAEASYFVERAINLNEAVQLAEKALEIGRELSDTRLQAIAHVRLAAIRFEEGRFQDSQTHSEIGLALAENNRLAGLEQAQSLRNLGRVETVRGDYEAARQYYQQALTLAQSSGNRSDEGRLLNELGIVDWRQGAYEQADAYLQQGLTIVRAVGARQTEADTLKNLGIVAWFQSEYERATTYYEQSRAIYKEIGDLTGESSILNNLGLVAWRQGEYGRASRYYEQSLDIKYKMGDRAHAGTTLGNMGISARAQGLYELANRYHEQSLAIAEEVGDQLGKGRTLNNLGVVAANLGQHERAVEYYKESLAIRREIGDQDGESNTLSNLGVVAYTQKEYERAVRYLRQSLSIAQEIGDRTDEAISLLNLGTILTGMGEYDEAEGVLQTAVAICLDLNDRNLMMELLAAQANLHFVRGEADEAFAALADVLIYLDDGVEFDGSEYGFRNYLICYRVLGANNQEERATAVLETAYRRLREQAEKIEDETVRQTFLKRVPWHREIIMEWGKRPSPQTTPSEH